MAAEEKAEKTYNATIYIVTNPLTPFNSLLVLNQSLQEIMTYDAINIPLTILSLNKTIKDTFRAPAEAASASASAVQDKSLGTRISELYDAIGIIL
jgi:hypothetical protein